MINERLSSFFLDKKSRISFSKLFFASLLFKIILFVFLNYFHNSFGFGHKKEGLFIYGNDTKSYLETIENLVDQKIYSIGDSPSAFRMPGLLPVYMPIYIRLPKAIAHQFFIILQVIADALIAVIIFKLLSLLFPGNIKISFGAWLLYIVSAYTSTYSHYFLPEIFATLALTASTLFLLQFLSGFSLVKIFISGIFMCWFVFLKPVGIVFIAVIPLLIAIYILLGNMTKDRFILWIKSSLIYVSFFLIFDTCWIIRNYNTFKTFTPLTSAFNSESSDFAMKKFFMSTGLSFQAFNGQDHLAWFAYKEGDKFFNKSFSGSDPFPAWIFTSKFNLDSLRTLRTIYWSMSETTDHVQRAQLNERFKKAILSYTESFKQEHPFHSYITVNLVFLKKLFFIKAAYGLPLTGKDVFQKGVRILYVLFYYFIVIGFFLFSILFPFRKQKRTPMVISMLLICWGIILSLVLLGAIENRYLVPVYPLLLVLSVMFYKDLLSLLRGKIFQPNLINEEFFSEK